MKTMNFKEYDEIIKKHKYDMLSMIIYYNLQCNNDLIINELAEEEYKLEKLERTRK